MLSVSKGQCSVGCGGEAVTGAMWVLAGGGGGECQAKVAHFKV